MKFDVIGDVHGEFDKLVELLSHLGYSESGREGLEGCAQAHCHSRDRVQRMDAPMQLLRGRPWSVGNYA
jgi:hypothetical protein